MPRKRDSHDRLIDAIANAMPKFGLLRAALASELRSEERELFRLALLRLGREAAGQPKPTPYMSIQEAADLLRVHRRSFVNMVSAAKRKGREFDWVLRQGRKRGFVIDRRKFIKFIERRAGRRGRPRKYEV